MKTSKAHARRIILGFLAVAATSTADAGNEASYRVNDGSWKVAQATTPPAKRPLRVEKDVDDPAKVTKGDTEAAIRALLAPTRYVVLAMFKFDGAAPAALANLPMGATSGLPKIRYDWPCDNCRLSGNMRWHDKKDIRKDGAPPAGWNATHMAAKTFATLHEANSWLADTAEGQFLRDNAASIVTFTTTDYSPLGGSALDPMVLPRIPK